MVTFITYTETDSHKDSNSVRFFLREQEGSSSRSLHVTQEISHIVVSREFTNQDTQRRLKELVTDPKYDGIKFEQVPYGKSKSFIRAILPKDRRHDLPSIFYATDQDGKGDPNKVDSPSRLVRWQFPPLSVVEFRDEALRTNGGKVGLESILNDRSCVIDPELGQWKTENPYISMVVFYTGNPTFGNYLLTVFNPGVRKIGDAAVEVFNRHNDPHKDQNDLVARLRELETTFDPLIVGGHNIPQDKKWLRDLPEEILYLPGVDGSKPIVKSARSRSSQATPKPKIEIRKTVTRGRSTVDTYRYCRNYLAFLQDNRLDTHATRAGFQYKKMIDYEQLEELTKKAEQGDQKSVRTLLRYTLEDGEASYALLRHLLPNIAVKMLAFHTDSDTVTSKSRLGLAFDRWKRQYFMQTGTFDDRWSRRYYPTEGAKRKGHEDAKVSLEKLATELIERELKESDSLHLIMPKVGFFEKVHMVYLTPFIMAFAPVITNDRDLSMLLSAMDAQDNGDLKFDLAQTLNAALVTPTLKLKDFLADAGYQLGQHIEHPRDIPLGVKKLSAKDWAFGNTYGINFSYDGVTANNWSINRNLIYALYGWQHTRGILGLLRDMKVVNHSGKFLFLEGDIDKIRQLERFHMLVYVGNGPAISTESRIIANVGGTPIYQGFLPKAGKKTRFDVELVLEFIDKALNGATPEQLYKYLDRKFLSLESGNVSKRDLLLKSRNRLYGVVGAGNRSLEMPAEEFLNGNCAPYVQFYKDNIRRNFGDIFQARMPPYYWGKLRALHDPRSLQLRLF